MFDDEKRPMFNYLEPIKAITTFIHEHSMNSKKFSVNKARKRSDDSENEEEGQDHTDDKGGDEEVNDD